MPIQEIDTIMTKDDSAAVLVDFARNTAKKLVSQNLARSQIRTIFTEVRQIEARWPDPEAERRLTMLKPKLAYQASRSNPVSYLRDVLSESIDYVIKAPNEEQKNLRFSRFMDLFEAILAYHRSEGGKN